MTRGSTAYTHAGQCDTKKKKKKKALIKIVARRWGNKKE
jgi:hypothetical protein